MVRFTMVDQRLTLSFASTAMTVSMFIKAVIKYRGGRTVDGEETKH